MKRYCLALDLVDNPEVIGKYEEYHENVWPEVEQSLRDAGIADMEIYRVENRLFMVLEVHENFSIEKKAELDEKNPTVQEWEKIMGGYQRALPGSAPGEKWRVMKKVYHFSS